jgi:hypothetical protein
MHPTASLFVSVALATTALGTAALFVLGHARVARAAGRSPLPVALGTLLWIAATGAIALSGILRRWDLRPPPFFLLALSTFVGSVLLARSRIGARLADGLPLWLLVAFQGFRLPLELVLHAAAGEGTMPVQMSYGGLNFDIATGITALLVAILLRAGLAGPRLALAWNLLGMTLLSIIVGIAIASTPVFHAFGPDRLNTWIAYFPFVWLLTVNVAAALFGHLVVWRRLASERVHALAPASV